MTMMCKFGTGLRHLQAHWFAAFEHIIADMQSSSEPSYVLHADQGSTCAAQLCLGSTLLPGPLCHILPHNRTLTSGATLLRSSRSPETGY